jgi:hypothetical protein
LMDHGFALSLDGVGDVLFRLYKDNITNKITVSIRPHWISGDIYRPDEGSC